MNKGNLGKQIHLLERDLVKRKLKIDMERRNILKSFQAIRRTSGNSDVGLPPEDRMDNIYAHSRHSKSGLRLSEKRLMEWKRRERELRRFMREMTIGSDLEISPRCYRVNKRAKMINDFGRDPEEQSAKVFRLYLENDKIQSKLEPRTKDIKALRLDKNHFIKIPCNAYIQDDLAQIVLQSDSIADVERSTGSRMSRSNSSSTSSNRVTPEVMNRHKTLSTERPRVSSRISLNRNSSRIGSGRHKVPASTSEVTSSGYVVYDKDASQAIHNQIPMKEERVSRERDRSRNRPGTTSQRDYYDRPTSSRSRKQGLSPVANSAASLATSPEVPSDQKQNERSVSSGRPKSAKQQHDRVLSSKLTAHLNRQKRRGDSRDVDQSRREFLERNERPTSVSQRTRSLSRSGNRSSLSNGSIENFLGYEDRNLTSASSRAKSVERCCGRNSRSSRSPSSRASNSLGFIADLFDYEDNCKSRKLKSNRYSPDSMSSTFDSAEERITSSRRTPRSSDSRSRATLLCPTKHDCLKTSSIPRSLAVKKPKPHVHTNHLYAPFVLDSTDDESESEDSFFSSGSDAEADTEDEAEEQGLQEQQPGTSVVVVPSGDQSNVGAQETGESGKNLEAVSNAEERNSQVNVVGAESSDTSKDADAVSKGLAQRSTVQKQVRFSDNEDTKPCESYTQPISAAGRNFSQTVATQASLNTTPSFQTTASQTIWSSGAEYHRAHESDPRRHSLPKSAKYPTLKQTKSATAVIHPTRYLRKTQSDIFVEHPPKINSTRPLTIGSLFNVSIALSKLTRKKSLRDLVNLNNPDLREAMRQERLKDLEIKSKQLSEEANNFKL
ncbi:hypothetical protein LOTGIDRAFT_168302 [Lottia gigantea]|uniref:Uncharacterized protein n=1 Tax=Lottia gigantea TaxID=225164 RepID=V3ZQN3_LOTGI|nr:hypothetical protein LOTGIDRAFT_168302 [Lottia gigantea]ESO84815.1 hypothetical protein LOTGIDRAFT_168302 [Lottia gigantea]